MLRQRDTNIRQRTLLAMSNHRSFGLILALTSLLCSAAMSEIGKNYSLVMVGGGLYDNNTAVWDRIIELGGGKGVARMGVVAAAGEDPCCDKQSSWVFYRDLLTYYGAAEVYYVPVSLDSTDQNTNTTVVAQIKTLTGFFFGGGDQTRVIESFYNYNSKVPSPVLNAIKETLLATGGVVAGTSAGTDCQTDKVMITGGMSYQAVVNGSGITWEPREKRDGNLLTGYGQGGIGLFSHGLLDTHFANRGRQGRLVQLLLDSTTLPRGDTRAFGMDENTALVITGPWKNRQATILGQRGGWVFSTENAVRSGSGAGSVVQGISVTRISSGDVLDLTTYAITPAAYKSVMVTQPVRAQTSHNIFGEDVFEFDKIATSLLQSSTSTTTTGTSIQATPQVTVTLGKDWAEAYSAGSHAAVDQNSRSFGGTDPETGLFAYCFSDVWMSITVGA